jgi:hypothetical protein
MFISLKRESRVRNRLCIHIFLCVQLERHLDWNLCDGTEALVCRVPADISGYLRCTLTLSAGIAEREARQALIMRYGAMSLWCGFYCVTIYAISIFWNAIQKTSPSIVFIFMKSLEATFLFLVYSRIMHYGEKYRQFGKKTCGLSSLQFVSASRPI